VVGSSELTASVIESSYERVIGIMDRIIMRQGFVMGSRPGSSDFAIFGQLTQLGLVDPTPARYLERHSPRLRAWLDRAEDLSGLHAQDWLSRDSIVEHLGELLGEIGRVYAPFLTANAKAAHERNETFETTIDGKRWVQPVFPYQVKCLAAIRHTRNSMPEQARHDLDSMLKGTGCEVLFA
jgi:hypothetical protein